MKQTTAKGYFDLTLPIYARSEANLRQHWAKKSPRVKQQRGVTQMACKSFCRLILLDGRLDGVVVTLTRIRPKGRVALDDDNLRSALKACRDGVADAMGINDNDPRVTWHYDQAGNARDYAVRIQIAKGGAA